MSPTETIQNLKSIVSVQKISLKKSDLEPVKPERLRMYIQKQYRKVTVFKIRYKSGKNVVSGYIAQPKKITKEPLPVIIYNRGGSGWFGEIKDMFTFSQMGFNLASEGYIVFASQYPGNAGEEGFDDIAGPTSVKAVLDLLPFIRQHPQADASRIGMIGGSRGGLQTLAVMCAKPRSFKAVAIFSAAFDNRNIKKERPKMLAHWESLMNKKFTKQDLVDRSPTAWVGSIPKKVPILIQHGSCDWRCTPQSAYSFASTLLEYKIPHRFIMYEGADHALTNNRKSLRDEQLAWMNRFVRDENKPPTTDLYGT